MSFFERNLKSIYVRLGSDHTTHDGETIPVQNLYFHPEFKHENLLNNLAIIGLEERVRLSKKQMKIRRIIWDKSPEVLPNDTKSVLIVGWGASKSGQVKAKKTTLRVGMLDVYNIDECRQKYKGDFINKENFCAAEKGESGGACNGDVGGPGIVGTVLVGVVSFGAPECGAASAPTVLTKLGYYVSWIESVMNAHSRKNQANHNNTITRRKSKDLKLNKAATRDQLRSHDNEYPDDIKAVRDGLLELVETDQSVVNDVIYGDYYDEFSKYFKSNEEMELKESSISTENEKNHQPTLTYTTDRTFQIKVNLDSEATTSDKTLSLRKPLIDSDYETDNDVVHNDYDNYEHSSEEEHALSIEVPSTEKYLENKGDMLTRTTNSESESGLAIPNESNVYSDETKEFYVRTGDNLEKKDSDKTHTAATTYITGARLDVNNIADTPFALEKSKRKGESTKAVIKKHEQLYKHASSVLDEGKLLATKTFIIDFNIADVHVANDKVLKNS